MASPALGAKFGSNLFVVVNFAVENDHVAAGCGKHRLMTFRRKVKNGKAPECEADPSCAVVEGSGIIRATMGESRAHPAQSFQGMFRSSFCLPESGNSTHGDASVTPKSIQFSRSRALASGHCTVTAKLDVATSLMQ